MALLYEEITAKIIGACFEVSQELGAGFLESVYQKALLVALRQKGIHAQAQVPLSVPFAVRQWANSWPISWLRTK
jgi:GxxExxY protein